MKTFALIMIVASVGIALLPPRVSWISMVDWGLALYWFIVWRYERAPR